MAAFSMADASWELDRPLLILDGIKRATVAGTPRAEAATAQHWGSKLTAAAGLTTSSFQVQTFHHASASNPCPLHSSGMDGTSANCLGSSAPASSPVQSPSPAHGTSVPALFLGDVFMPSYSSSIPQADIPAGLAPPYSLALVQGLPSLCMRQERAEAIVKELQEGLMQATGANQKEVEEKGGGGLCGLLPHFRMPWQQPQEAETKARHAEGGTAGGGASSSPNSAAQAQASTQPSMTVRRLPLLAALKMLQPAHPGGGPRRWPQFHMLTEHADAEAVENAAEEQSFVVDLSGLSDSHMPIEVWEGEEEDAIHSVDTADGKEDGRKDDTKDGISTISMMRFGKAKQMARDANAAALPSAGPNRLTVFRIPGFALMLRTNAGLVSFQPAFLSCYHLHKVLASAIRVYKKGWLMQRQAARDQWRRGIETTAVKLAGNAWLVSQINRSKGAADSDAEESDDDGEAWGMPAEAAELMEELGEKSGAVQLTLPSGDDFASHVSAVAVGTISVATRAAVWALDALDSAVANTPFGNWVMGIPNYVSVQADYLDDHVLALKLFNEQRLKFLPPPTDPAANTPATSTPLPASTPGSAAATSHPKDDVGPSQKSMAYARKKVAQVLAHQLDVRDFEMEADEEDGICFSSESALTSGRVGGQQEDEANQKPHNDNSHKSAAGSATALGDVDYDNYRQATGVRRLQCPDCGQNFRQNNDDHDQSGLHYSFWQAAPSWPQLATLKQLKCGGKPALHVVTGCGSLPLLTDSDNLCTGCHGLSCTTHCDNLSLSTGSHDATGGRALYHAACSATSSASPCRPLPAQTHEQVYERSRQLMHRVMGLLYAEQQSPGFPGSSWKHPAHESHVAAGSGPAHHMPHSTGPAHSMPHDAWPAHIMAHGTARSTGPACSMIHSTGLAGSMNYSTTTTSCSPRPSPATSSLCTPPSALPSSSSSPSFGASSLCPLYCSSLNNPRSAMYPVLTANHPGGQTCTGFCPTLLAATASNVTDAPVTTSSSPNSASSCSPAPTSILPGGDSAQDVAGDSLQDLAKVTSWPALPIPYLAPSPLHAAICHTFPPLLPACNEFSQGGNDYKQDHSQTRFRCCAMPAILSSSSASSAQNLRAGHFGKTPGQQINRQSTQQARNGLTHCSTQHSAQQSTQQSLGEHANEQGSQHSGEPVNKSRSWWQIWRRPSQQDSPQVPSINSPHSLPPSQSPTNSKRGTDSTPTHTAVAAETIPLPTNPDQHPIRLTPDHPDVGKRDPPLVESHAAHAQDPLFNCHPGQEVAGAMPPQLAGDVTANAGALLPKFPEQLPATALSPTTLFPALHQPGNSKHSSSGGDQNIGLGPGHTSHPLPPPSHSFLPSTNPQQRSSTNSVDASSTPPCGQGKLGSRGSDIVRNNSSNDDSHSSNSKNNSNSNNSSSNNNSGHGIPDIQSYTSQPSSSHCNSTANQGSNTAASNTGDSRRSGSTNSISNHSSNDTNNAANNTGDPQSSSSPNNNSSNNSSSSSNSSPHSGQVSARGSSHRRRNAAVPRLQLESLHGVGSLLRVIWTVWWDMEAGEGRFVERIFKANQYNSANMNAYLGTVLTSLGDKLEVHMRIGITNLGLPLNPQSMLPVPFPSPHATASPSASRSPMPAVHPPAVSNTSPLPATSISFQTTSQKGGMQPHEFDVGLLLDTKRMFAKAEDGGDDVEWNGRVAECGITPARGLLLIGDLGFEQPGYVQELGFADMEELGVRGVKVVCMPDSND